MWLTCHTPDLTPHPAELNAYCIAVNYQPSPRSGLAFSLGQGTQPSCLLCGLAHHWCSTNTGLRREVAKNILLRGPLTTRGHFGTQVGPGSWEIPAPRQKSTRPHRSRTGRHSMEATACSRPTASGFCQPQRRDSLLVPPSLGSISSVELSRFPCVSTSPVTPFPPGQDQAPVSEARRRLLPWNRSFGGAARHSQGEAKGSRSLQTRKPLEGQSHGNVPFHSLEGDSRGPGLG